MKWNYNDGGRKLAGFKGSTGDCVTRAIAIATGKPYKEVYNDLFTRAKEYSKTRRNKIAKSIQKYGATPRNGMWKEIYRPYLESLGWKYKVGNVKLNEFPAGTYICSVRKHLTVVKDGELYDTWDCSMRSGGIDRFTGEEYDPDFRTAFHHYVKE